MTVGTVRLMDDLRELYQTTILDHNKQPEELPQGRRTANRRGRRPQPALRRQGDCLRCEVDDGRPDLRHRVRQGNGLRHLDGVRVAHDPEFVKGKTLDEIARDCSKRFHELVTGDPERAGRSVRPHGVGKLAVFAGVREYPMRVKCATLAWHTMQRGHSTADQSPSPRPSRHEPIVATPEELKDGVDRRAPADGLRPRDPGRHLRARPDLRGRGAAGGRAASTSR